MLCRHILSVLVDLRVNEVLHEGTLTRGTFSNHQDRLLSGGKNFNCMHHVADFLCWDVYVLHVSGRRS
jgi:hypothetical protein